MLLEFSVNNFLSIKDTAKISFNTAKGNTENSFEAKSYHLLRSAGIFGPNASGKSNVLKAFGFMKDMVLNRSKIIQSTDKLPHSPFKLNSETEASSSLYEIVFFTNDVKYRYGFDADESNVYSEWLFADEKGKEAKLFSRDIDRDEYYNNDRKFKEGKGLKIPKNHLFLWRCDQEGGEISRTILKWFKKLNLIEGQEVDGYSSFAMSQMEDPSFARELTALVRSVADLGIENIHLEDEPIELDQLQKHLFPGVSSELTLSEKSSWRRVFLKTLRPKYDHKGKRIGSTSFELYEHESLGTRKFFFLSAPILDTLRKGKILLIDELGASMHPLLTKELIKLFNNPQTNKRNAQLLFVTHDLNLLTPSLLGRDQIWFTEKDEFGATKCFSLGEIKAVRKDDNWVKKYLFGNYGAIPYFDFTKFYQELIDG